MADEKRCTQCGTVLAADAPQGLCPACLLKRGLESGSAPGESAPPPTPAELAQHFPELEILELIGRGGMGAVYKARQKRLDRVVALKVLPSSVSRDPAFAERFARESRALAKLTHPNIVTVHDSGQTDGLFYFVMEFVDGMNLRQLLNTGRIAPKEALAIVPQICDALQYAHDKGIVHRDIKPENILLDKAGTVKIADFGLAKLVGLEAKDLRITGSGDVMGTPHYMAPEQVEHPQDVDHRADIYSLGVVFYQMLTGELPIGRFAPPSRKVQIDVRLDEVVLRALEKEPELRYQHASDVRTQVETILTSPGSASLPASVGKRQTQKSSLVTERDGETVVDWPAVLRLTGLLFVLMAAVVSLIWLATGRTFRLGQSLLQTFTCIAVWVGASAAATRYFRNKRAPSLVPSASPAGTAVGGKSQTPTTGWGYLVGQMFGFEFVSPLAFKLANLSALGFLCFLGFVPLPGWQRCFGFSGFFGLIGLGFIVERFRNVIVVGRRGDKAVINWPGVLFMFAVSLAVAESVVALLSLAIVNRIDLAPVLATFAAVLASTAVAVSVRQRITPLEKLKPLDGSRLSLAAVIGACLLMLLPAAMVFAYSAWRAANDAASAIATYGPVIERVITVGNDARSFYSFDRGDYVPGPTSFDPSEEKNNGQLWKWMTANHVDVFARARDGRPVLICSEMVTKGLNEDAFDRLTPAQLAADDGWKSALNTQFRAQESSTLGRGILRGSKDTLAFQTRYGVIGLIQVVDVTSDPPGVKIRYKLVHNGGGQNRSAMTAVHDWLALMDAGEYARSWETAAPYFQQVMAKDEWIGRLEKVRRPLGGVVSRKLSSTEVIAGGGLKAKFNTSFESQPETVEIVSVARQASGEWQAIGYLIRPGVEGGWTAASHVFLVSAVLIGVAILIPLLLAWPITGSFKRIWPRQCREPSTGVFKWSWTLLAAALFLLLLYGKKDSETWMIASVCVVVLSLASGGEFLVRCRERRKTESKGRPGVASEGSSAPRLSLAAVIGACLALLPFVTGVATLIGRSLWMTHREYFPLTGPNLFGVLLWLLLLASIPASLGTTILGWVAVSQIRRSAGKLYGLGLALVDALVFPLLALDCGIVYATFVVAGVLLDWPQNYNQLPGPSVVSLVGWILAIVADVLIIVWAWRAARKPVAGFRMPPLNEQTRSRTFASLALGLFVVGVLGTVVLMVFSRNDVLPFIFGGIALVLALVFGAISWRHRLGKSIVIATLVLFAVIAIVVGFLSGVIPDPFRARRRALAEEQLRQQTEKRMSELMAEQQVLTEWDWSAATGAYMTPVTVDGRAALKVDNTSDHPLRLTLHTIESPPITSQHYAVTGEIKWENVQGDGVLEMWSYWQPLRPLPSGLPMGRISGTSSWHTFILPFNYTGPTNPPTRLEINIFLPGRGVVFLGPTKLMQPGSATGPAPPSLTGAELIKVPFAAGPSKFTDGDVIVIQQVLATSPNPGIGDKVVVRGRYDLKSEKKAMLGLFVTSIERQDKDRISPTQTMEVNKGSGQFELAHEVRHAGALHVSFYPASGGESFGGVYFVTEPQMEKTSSP